MNRRLINKQINKFIKLAVYGKHILAYDTLLKLRKSLSRHRNAELAQERCDGICSMVYSGYADEGHYSEYADKE